MNNGADVFAFHQTDENVGVHDATEMTFANATDVTRDVEYGNDADRAVEGDAYATETTYNSYGSNLKNSCSGALFGLLLFFGSFGLLIYNEGRTVKRAKDIDEGQKLVTTLNLGDFTNATSEISKYEGMLVHVVGDLSTTDTLIDPIFGVGPNLSTSSRKTGSLENMPLKLSRRISMYQWVESTSTKTIKSSNGQTITSTDYHYQKQWSSQYHKSKNFKYATSHSNPTEFPFQSLELTANPIKLGNISLSRDTVGLINWFEQVDSGISLNNISDGALRDRLDVYFQEGLYYSAENSSSNTNPKIGDARITFAVVPPDTISIVAKLRSDGLGKYVTSRGGSLLLLKRGVYTSEEIFQEEDEKNTTIAWILRTVGFFLMVISILLMLQPIATAVDIIPFVGDCMQGGLEKCVFPTIALLIAVPFSLFTIALAWLAYRPAWSIPILLGSACAMLWFYFRVKRVKSEAEAVETNKVEPDGNMTNEGGKLDNNSSHENYQYTPDQSIPIPDSDEPDIIFEGEAGNNNHVPEVYKPK